MSDTSAESRYCWYCSRIVRLTPQGLLRRHTEVPGRGKRCDGSGRDPREWETA